MVAARIGNVMAAVLAASVCFAPVAQALKIEFPLPQFEPSGPRSKGRMFVTNDGNKIAGYQIGIETRMHDAEGAEHNADASSDFAIFPKQLLLEPGAERMVTVHWKGPRRLDVERAYRLVIEELPVAVDEPMKAVDQAASIVRVLTKVKKTIYVGPYSAQSELMANAARLVVDDDGKPRLQFMLKNRGDGHEIVKQLGVRISQDVSEDGAMAAAPRALTIEIGPEMLGSKMNVLAGEERRISIAWPPELPEGPVTVSLK